MQKWEKCESISLEFDGTCGKFEFGLDLMQNIWCNALQISDKLWIYFEFEGVLDAWVVCQNKCDIFYLLVLKTWLFPWI